ncbi:MAG: hypothetical protein A2252_01585 [Elusimicrobia bacterium RIFOXYA2_FULL_39_19]|nr:MAG: hypothetical protein A2252_01585 [Elusimicrobia bacterium RIFOXYA2_FULL_39_19]
MHYEKILKSLSDRTRLRILYVLLKAKKELCICEIMDTLALEHYNVSKHMKELKVTGLVKEQRSGKFVFYALADNKDSFVRNIVEAVAAIPETEFNEDTKRLNKRLTLRQNGKCVVGILKKSRKQKG